MKTASKIEPIYIAIGERIRELRKGKGMTQEALAEPLNASRGALVNMEQGRQRILPHTLIKLACLLGCTVGDLWQVAPIPEPEPQGVIPLAKYKLGDPVFRNGSIDFVGGEPSWDDARRVWRYWLDFSQPNMCDLTHWQGGGHGGGYDETDFTEPTPKQKLLGELWRGFRTIKVMEVQSANERSKIQHLKFALLTIDPALKTSED